MNTARIITSMPSFVGVVSGQEQLGPHSEAGVVDQHVDRLVGTGQPLGDPDHVVADAEIGEDRLDVDPVPVLQFGRGVGQPVGVPSHQHEIVAARRQRSGERRADA